ncbi:MAG: hypothetical protein AMXMBFR64_17330 [Myxococcales bacterium]
MNAGSSLIPWTAVSAATAFLKLSKSNGIRTPPTGHGTRRGAWTTSASPGARRGGLHLHRRHGEHPGREAPDLAPETEVTWTLRARVADDDTPWSEPIATGTAQAGSSAIVHVPTNYAALRLELSGDATVVVRLTQRMPN